MSIERVSEEDVRDEVRKLFEARGQKFDDMVIAWMPGNEVWIYEVGSGTNMEAGTHKGRNPVSIGTRAFMLMTKQGPRVEEPTIRLRPLFSGAGWMTMSPMAFCSLQSLETEQLSDLARQIAEFDRIDKEAPRSPLAM